MKFLFRTKTAELLLLSTPFLIGLLIAAFAPNDVLANEIFDGICRLASTIIPAIKKINGNYERVQVVKLYFSVLWLLSPLIFIAAYINLQRQSASVLEKGKKKRVFLTLILGIIFPAAAVALAFANPEGSGSNDARSQLITSTTLGLAIWGYIIPCGASVLLAATYFWLKHINVIFDQQGE